MRSEASEHPGCLDLPCGKEAIMTAFNVVQVRVKPGRERSLFRRISGGGLMLSATGGECSSKPEIAATAPSLSGTP